MAKVFVDKICTKCGKPFRTNNNSDKCYDCTLEELTGGIAPEEGDFNTARITSGTMNDQEYRNLQRDLKSVELG